jgi:hypothetical protein
MGHYPAGDYRGSPKPWPPNGGLTHVAVIDYNSWVGPPRRNRMVEVCSGSAVHFAGAGGRRGRAARSDSLAEGWPGSAAGYVGRTGTIVIGTPSI